MAKSSRVKGARTPTRKAARKQARPAARRTQAPRRGAKARTTRPATPKRTAAPKRSAATPGKRVTPPPVAAAPKPAPQKPEAAAPAQVPARKPTYHEAVSMYERGLQALQRRDFSTAAEHLRTVIERYPDERELLDRARLYLKVCERELEAREPAPKSADELVNAATIALNAGNETAAAQHLSRVLADNPRHDYAHYMMAVAAARRNDAHRAVDHLRQAVSLNPDNRSLARQDPEFDGLRDMPGYREALEAQPGQGTQPQPRPSLRPRKIRR